MPDLADKLCALFNGDISHGKTIEAIVAAHDRDLLTRFAKRLKARFAWPGNYRIAFTPDDIDAVLREFTEGGQDG